MKFSYLCRTCLRSDKDLAPISDSLGPKFSSYPVGVSQLWKILVEMLASEKEDCSDHMCLDCIVLIQRTYLFMTNAEKSGDILKSMKSRIKTLELEDTALEVNDPNCNKNRQIPERDHNVTSVKESTSIKEEVAWIDDYNDEQTHEHSLDDISVIEINPLAAQDEYLEEYDQLLDSNDRVFECPICRLTCSQQRKLEVHIAEVHSINNKCEICYQEISGKKVQHLAQHLAANTLSYGKSAIDERSKFQCTFCLRVLSSQFLYDEHSAFHNKSLRPFKCGQCPEVFRFRANLIEHISGEHGNFEYAEDLSQVQCTTCWRIFGTTDDLAMHASSHNTAPVEFSCGECSMYFVSEKMLKVHNTEKHPILCPDTNRFRCLLCPELFKHKLALLVHLRLHRNEFKCDRCPKVYQNRLNLNRHIMQKHEKGKNVSKTTKKQDLTCTVCSKVFTRATQLRVHMLIHNNEQPYACEKCPATFRYRAKLKIHVATLHLDETKLIEGYYKCEICSQVFPHPSELKIHLRKHTGEKPFECKLCRKRFAWSSHYKYHLKRHASANPFKCDSCSQSFGSKQSLGNHIKRYHPDKIVPSSTQKFYSKSSKSEDFACEICLKTFDSREAWRIHSVRDHDEEHDMAEQHNCKYCDRKFWQVTSLEHHIRTEHGEELLEEQQSN